MINNIFITNNIPDIDGICQEEDIETYPYLLILSFYIYSGYDKFYLILTQNPNVKSQIYNSKLKTDVLIQPLINTD
ncbi:MAG: hypothetical protein AB1422_08850 [bacterium]